MEVILTDTIRANVTRAWITQLADDERRRDALRAVELDAAAGRAELVRRHGRGLIGELHAAMTDDVEAFRNEFPGDRARELVIDPSETGAEGAFAVRKPGPPAVTLSVAPRWDAGSVSCRYCFTTNNGMPAREDRFDLVLTRDGADGARFKHQNSGQVFATADALSEYLLRPVFTGRPR